MFAMGDEAPSTGGHGEGGDEGVRRTNGGAPIRQGLPWKPARVSSWPR